MHPDIAQNLSNLGTLYSIQSRDAEAEPLLQRSLAIRKQTPGPMHPDVAQSLNNLAGLYRNWGRYTEAELLLQRVLTIAEQVFAPTHPLVTAVRKNYAALLQAKQHKATLLISLWRRLRAWLSRTRAIR
jgi:tetratricopeptide (TPR) repeat protein